MRPIDADALKEDFETRYKNAEKWIEKADDEEIKIRATATRDFIAEVIMTINKASTVEPEVKKVPIASVTFDTEKLKELTDGIVESIKNGELVLQDERLKGEWIAMEPYTHKTFCPFCKEDTKDEVYGNFCPNCGADMRGDAE